MLDTDSDNDDQLNFVHPAAHVYKYSDDDDDHADKYMIDNDELAERDMILDCDDQQMLHSSTSLIYSDGDDDYMTDNDELAEGEGYNTSL